MQRKRGDKDGLTQPKLEKGELTLSNPSRRICRYLNEKVESI